MSIQNARAQQQQQQINAIRRSRVTTPAIVASDPVRDPVDGGYTVTAADGSIVRQNYISNSKLDQSPSVVVPSRTIGLPGYLTQKPS
jgi:hypothetical protein